MGAQDNINVAHRAARPDSSAWVSAHAGSGKTHVLVTRIVRLLLNDVAPERILCLTYTRTAAAEMQDRLAGLLADWVFLDDAALAKEIKTRCGAATDAPALQRARRLFARALETPGGLRVQTIHAFCRALLHQFPLEAGVSPQFTLLTEAQSKALMQEALLAARQEAHIAAALGRLLRRVSGFDLSGLLSAICAHRDAFAAMDSQKIAASEDAIWGESAARFADEQAAIVSAVELLCARHGDLIARLDSVSRDARVTDFAAARADAPHAAWAAFIGFFLDSSASPRKNILSAKLMKAANIEAEKLAAMAADFHACNAARCAALLVENNTDLYVVAGGFLQHYARLKARNDGLDYDDLIRHTHRLLTQAASAAWVLFKIDGGLDHILVDEAQDTSPQQWALVAALIEEFFAGSGARDVQRSMFAVGDPKQSIFSFQGADLKAFHAMRAWVAERVRGAEADFADLALTKSYRATPQILAAVDGVFAQGAARIGLTGEADAAPLAHQAARENAQGYVEFWPLCLTDEAQADDDPTQLTVPPPRIRGQQKLAQRIAQTIVELTTQGGYRAGDMLILVRARGVFSDHMLRELKRAGVPVAGADRLLLNQELAVMDLVNAADFALAPDNDLALAIFLRSPFGGVSEDALMALAIGREASLWQVFCRAAEAPDAPPHFVVARQRLDWLLAHADRLAPFDYFSRFLRGQGGYAALAARMGSEIDDALDAFLQCALDYEQEAAISLQGFLHAFRHEAYEVKRDMEQGQDAVRIMTVHAAKGLEAPIVFLPDTCTRPSGPSRMGGFLLSEDGVPIWRSRQDDQCAYAEGLRAQEIARQHEEEHRLLYVAMTRARDRLYIGGFLGARRKDPPEGCWWQLIYEGLRAAADIFDPADKETIARIGAPAEKSHAEIAAPATPAAPDWLTASVTHAPQRHAFFTPSRLHDSGDAPAPDSTAHGVSPRLRGKVAHRLLEVLPAQPAGGRAAFTAKRLAAALPDMPQAARAKLADDILATLAHPELAAIFSPDARAEVPICGVLALAQDARAKITGVIDRLIIEPQRVVFVDFKTGTPPDNAKLPAAYRAQMAAYYGLLAAAYPKHEIIGGLVWVEGAHVQWLDMAELQAALTKLPAPV